MTGSGEGRWRVHEVVPGPRGIHSGSNRIPPSAPVKQRLRNFGTYRVKAPQPITHLMTGLADELDGAIAQAVQGQRTHGYSWAEIGARRGIHPPGCTAAMGSAALAGLLRSSSGPESRSCNLIVR